jgi:hypothetical protein
MNADGFEDIAIGAPESAGGPGAAYVFLGPQAKSATLADADAVMSPDELDLDLGWELAGPADYDDDGYDDLAVGSERHGMNGGVFVMGGPPVSAQSGVDATAIIRGHRGDVHGFSMSAMPNGGGTRRARDRCAQRGCSQRTTRDRDRARRAVERPLLHPDRTACPSCRPRRQSAFGSAVATTSGRRPSRRRERRRVGVRDPVTAFGF